MRCAVLVLLAVPGVAAAQTPTAAEIAATVNGEPITVAELDAAVDADLPNVPLTLAQRRQLRAALLDDLINEAVLKQFLAKSGVKPDQAVIDAQMKVFTEQLAKENRTLAQYLKDTGQTETRLRELWTVQNQLLQYVKQRTTDEQLKAYHAANRDHFDRVEVRLSHILLRTPKGMPPTERAAAKEKLRAIRTDILAGRGDFAAAARRFSQCPSAKSGGNLGYILRRAMPEDEPLAKAAFAMKIGELSDVIESEYGLHLILVTDRKPGTPSVLEKCAIEVLETYAEDQRAELVKKLRREAQIKITLP
jgi:peptidyl-prolyl cis-trans isomerase C